jgi:SPP1 gp7 family putative phage head morphogenesis protein
MPRLDVDKFLEDLTGRYASPYIEQIQEMVVAMAMGNGPKLEAARKRLAEVARETMGIGEVLGASMALQTAAPLVVSPFSKSPASVGMWSGSVQACITFADEPTQKLLPRVTFEEAGEDMVQRTPTTIRSAAERTWQRIAKLYGEGSGGIPRVAFVRSAEATVTKRVQALFTEAIREGIPGLDFMSEGKLIPGAGKRMVDAVNEIRKHTGAWSESYARMAFRTNVNTAVTAGRFRQTQDQDIKAVVPCFRFDAVGDSDTRPNHLAADGLIFKVDNLVWNKIAPPLGYNCRCRASFVSLPQLRRMGRVRPDGSIREDRLPGAARPDAGFRHGGRPDLFGVNA